MAQESTSGQNGNFSLCRGDVSLYEVRFDEFGLNHLLWQSGK